MDNNSGSLVCTATCWGVALLGGILACGLLMVLGGWSFMQGLFVGVVLFVIAGALLSWLLCKPLPAPGTVSITPSKPGEHPASSAPVKTAAASSAPASGGAVKSSQLPGQQELAARKGEWKYGDDTAGVGESQPETLSSARGGQPDDLKKLKGVGPKLEGVLHELGFFHFDQIAKWTDAEVAWVDERLKFKGRIERDGWIEQAKILAAGGETDFSKKK